MISLINTMDLVLIEAYHTSYEISLYSKLRLAADY